ncbi:MAG: C_GCAxxG_C_C family protein [Muribaculaceae bacterium]|nr:C_GCAxxG_C_C family protein [Muribaculaceae bacterium]
MEEDLMMSEMPRRERAVMYKHDYNCCQAVLLAFAPELGLPKEKLLAMGACFGSGMGCMEETCGALCGAQIAQGLLKYDNRRMNPQASQLRAEFEQRCGATRCKDLKGVGSDRGPLCSCEDCVRHAVEALEEKL